MPYIFGYTKSGDRYYFSGNADNYPGLTALNCDVNDAMHLAFGYDREKFFPLRNNTGILFPKADYRADVVGGVTKTLIQPWIFRTREGDFGVCAVRRNQDAPDDSNKGSIMLFFSEDLIHYTEEQFLKADEDEICNPRCRWDSTKQMYYLEWENEQGVFCGYTSCFDNIQDKKHLGATSFELCGNFGIEGIQPGNVIDINDEEAKKILVYLGGIYNTDVVIPALKTKQGECIEFEMLPKAKCVYNDGSEHNKKVIWSEKDYRKVDFSRAGTYTISGEVINAKHEFPFVNINVSDPYILYHQNQYYMILLDLIRGTGVVACKSDTIEGLKGARRVEILFDQKSSTSACGNWWAPELHIIEGIPYIFTTSGTTSWNTTKSCIYKCEGEIMNPGDWKGPYLVVKPDGTSLRPDGVSLDMTYFNVKETHYVMWSDRKWADANKELEPKVQDSADICIACVNPEKPWELVTMPVCIRKPIYGWERYETKVDEGPFLLRHGDDLFVTIACSSTGLADLYCVGILHSTVNSNLLSPEGWDWVSYPVLTKESIPGEYGPGHNCFVKDIENDDDIFVYHAVPHDKCGKSLGRYMGIRRVHWGSSGYPYLEMTKEQDLNPELKKIELTIEIE
ncbi:family 43 glycosylhydrolase [Muricomes intestini]|uniref:family 43 glycosylhydrolase n=1 Tax=Muricomes intestini TaxID=1796634 RepID=UPI002FE0C4A9